MTQIELGLSATAYADRIDISFTATICSDGGVTNDNVSGQFTLDDSVAFGINSGGLDGIIESASASLLGSTEFGNTASGFTFSSAATRSGYGIINLIADYGTGLFSLELASNLFFPSSNVYDALAPGLALADLRAFDALAESTRLINFVGYSTMWQGALTSLTVANRVVPTPEPATLWLALLVAPIVLRWSRKT